MKKKIVLFVVCYAVWCLLNWVPDWQHLSVGMLAAAFVAFMIGDIFLERPGTLKHPHRYWHFIFSYLPLLFVHMAKAGVEVGTRILRPGLAFRPGIVRVKTSLKSDIALTFLANTITLTSGTMTVDIDKGKGILYVHWVDVKAQDIEGATLAIVSRFEKVLAKIFD